jgi:hypothetical protein
MQLLDIWRRFDDNGMFFYEFEIAYSSGRRKTRKILLDAPDFSKFTWNRETERFPTQDGDFMGATANSDLDRIERWIEDVFDETFDMDIHVDDLMKLLLVRVAEKENQFRARFVGEFRKFRRSTFVKGIGRLKVTDDEKPSDIYIGFPPIPPSPYLSEIFMLIQDLHRGTPPQSNLP